jgi:hypothetical protein
VSDIIVKFSRAQLRATLLVVLTLASIITIVSMNTKQAHAATTISSNADDIYSGGSWLGLRPQGPNEIVNFNQTVTNEAVSSDSVAEVMLSARIISLQTGAPDSARLSFIVNTNSRHGVTYNYAMQSLLYPYGINTATNTGIHCYTSVNPCGAWISIPTMVFYGAGGLGGNYYKVWVSCDGYISVVGPSARGALGPGVIAPLSKSLDCTHGNIWTWWDSSGGFYVAWDNVLSGSRPQSFYLWVRAPGPPISQNGESNIEFWYNSVTQDDGLTAIGIADQYGGRIVSVDPTLYQLNNQRIVITATDASKIKYLNSLKVSLADTSGGATDSQAQVGLDPLTNPPGNPLGYNILVNPSGPPTIDLPDYARVGLGAGSLVTSLSAARIAAGLPVLTSGLEFVDPAVGVTLLGIDTYNMLVQNYRNAQQISYYTQTSLTDPSPTFIHAWAAQGGVSYPNFAPVDASLAGSANWILSDTLSRNLPHHLTITATIGYTDNRGEMGADTYTVSTSVQLDMNPGYKILSENFEGGSFSPNYWTWTAPWQVVSTDQCPKFNGLPNCIQGTKLAWSNSQSNTIAPLILTLGNLVNYNQVVIYLHLWTSVTGQVSISYQDLGVWKQWTSYGKQSTDGPRADTAYTQWINARLVVPTTTTAIGFTYSTTSDPSPGQGFYMDDIYVMGDGPLNSADVQVDGQLLTNPAQYHAVPVSMDNGPYYSTTDHFLELVGTSHTLTATSLFTDNTGSYSFASWSNGATSPSTTITVGGAQTILANYNVVPDFTVTTNPSSLTIDQGSSKTTTVYVTSRAGFAGSVYMRTTSPSGTTASPPSPSITIPPNGQASYILTITVGSSVPQGQHDVTLIGTSGSGLSNSGVVHLTIGAGGGSVAAGTMITLASGFQIPVQKLKPGMQLLSYDTEASRFVTSTVTRFVSVKTNNFMVINTTTGSPLVTDQNPAQRIYVMFPNGTRTMLPVTMLQVGYYLFNVPTLSWVGITSLNYHTGGSYTMYDIYNTAPGNYVANGYLDPFKD